ncbi:nucleotidyltransferase family protein [Methylobacterium oryzisoli]|uniref:nucleotidyltransferase family protein n=1 Tax=Methylobacterium oryzisoli TaxID=3385502 RepID=UPI003892CA46
MRSIEEVLQPPTDAQAAVALARFAADVRRHYGPRLLGLYLFGSRSRGDARPESDADVAVILVDGPWRIIDEARVLADLSYDRLIDDGLDIQAHPVPQSAWGDPALHPNPALVRAMRRDGRPLGAMP